MSRHKVEEWAVRDLALDRDDRTCAEGGCIFGVVGRGVF